jgi:hypothetical protein
MPLKKLGILILLLTTLNRVRAQGVPAATGAQDSVTAYASPFTDQLRRTVVFLRVGFTKEGRDWEIVGTGFFVMYPDERLGKDGSFMYLVTNRHMAVPGSEEGHSYPVKYSYVRLNARRLTGGRESFEIPLTSEPSLWVIPEDPSVDLAIIPVNMSRVDAEFQTIPVSVIATRDVVQTQQIVAGDQVLFAGYFYQFPGKKRIEPIVREGILAMLPEEPIGTTLQKPGNVYLADIHAFHGNSGSPIFVNTGGLRAGQVGASRFLLLGVVSGYYPESETDFSIPAARILSGEVHDNSGVTVIVPGDEIKALLDIPALKRAREVGIENFLKKK